MRVQKDGLTVHAIPAGHSVQFGFDANDTARAGLKGFALGRRQTDGSVAWQRGYKFFPSQVADPLPGETRSTRDHPIQDFQWGDYRAKPGETYDYVVQGVYGVPGALTYSGELELTVSTENPDVGAHGVYFNQGAIASQAFANNFGNVGPGERQQDDPENVKVKWLSRGLLEGALQFIAQANGGRFELRVAAYEFSYQPILEALKAAAGTGAKVKISFHGGDRIGEDYVRPEPVSCSAWAAIRKAKLLSVDNLTLLPRTRYSAIPHNKFMVLLDNDRPVQVWTGSTNLTPSGFLGQCNVGHILRNEPVAQSFNRYWAELAADPKTTPFKSFNNAHTPTLAGPLAADTVQPMFSPREARMMDWYAQRLGDASSAAMFTAAFGVDRSLAAKFGEDRDYLRFLLMERKDRRADVMALLRQDRADTKIALGNKLNSETIALELDGYRLDQWFRTEEHFRKKGHIFYIHTKFMLLDAFSDDPSVFSGSANFSNNSVNSNDENMVLMRGSAFRGVARSYAVEFMRMFRHLYFRTVAVQVARAGQGGRPPIVFLDESDGWVARHFVSDTYKDRLRRLFR